MYLKVYPPKTSSEPSPLKTTLISVYFSINLIISSLVIVCLLGIFPLLAFFNLYGILFYHLPIILLLRKNFFFLLQIHLQPDLDDSIMAEHFPMLELINLNRKELKIPIDMGTHYYYYCAFKKKIIN